MQTRTMGLSFCLGVDSPHLHRNLFHQANLRDSAQTCMQEYMSYMVGDVVQSLQFIDYDKEDRIYIRVAHYKKLQNPSIPVYAPFLS